MSDLNSILHEVALEHDQQPLSTLDRGHSRDIWASLITAYVGRCGSIPKRNQGEDFRTNMTKVAALAIRAIEAHDKGWC